MNLGMKVASSVLLTGGTYAAIYFGHQMLVPNYEGKEVLTGKTVLVTGATSGVGKAVALNLAAKDAKVILGCRDQEKCIWVRREVAEKTKNEQVFCSMLDLASLQSIKEFVHRMKSKDINFDVVVNNAGVMRCPKTYTKEGFEMHLGVNHLGHFFLTYLLLDDLKSRSARIINVTDQVYKKGQINLEDLNSEQNYDAVKAYNQSKLANVLFTQELASRLQGSGAHVFAADPGICNTDIMRHMGVHKSLMGKIFVKPFLKLFGRSPDKGAQVIVHCALSPDLSDDHANGKLYRDNKEVEIVPHAKDDILAKKLWLISERWTVNRDKPSDSSLRQTATSVSPNS